MKIKCPQCSATNEVQKHCGNCGSLLLKEGAEIEQSSLQEVEVRQKPKKMNRWLIGFLIFLGVWILGSIVLDLFLVLPGLDSKYSGVIAFALGIVFMIWYGMDFNSSEQVEE